MNVAMGLLTKHAGKDIIQVASVFKDIVEKNDIKKVDEMSNEIKNINQRINYGHRRGDNNVVPQKKAVLGNV